MGDGDATIVLPDASPRLWHVTLVVTGPRLEPDLLRSALERLAQERPFLLSARYAADRAEVRYWEEAACLDDAAALALRLWGEHRASAGLPAWSVAGLEVIDRPTYQWRARRAEAPVLIAAGGIEPFAPA